MLEVARKAPKSSTLHHIHNMNQNCLLNKFNKINWFRVMLPRILGRLKLLDNVKLEIKDLRI